MNYVLTFIFLVILVLVGNIFYIELKNDKKNKFLLFYCTILLTLGLTLAVIGDFLILDIK